MRLNVRNLEQEGLMEAIRLHTERIRERNKDKKLCIRCSKNQWELPEDNPELCLECYVKVFVFQEMVKKTYDLKIMRIFKPEQTKEIDEKIEKIKEEIKLVEANPRKYYYEHKQSIIDYVNRKYGNAESFDLGGKDD